MRRVAILSAGAALVLALVIPGMAEATGRSTSQGTTDAASAQLDNPIVAQGKGGHGHRGGSHKGSSHKGSSHKGSNHRGYRHGYRDGRHDGRHRHGYHRYGYYGYPYYYGGYWGGGYGCNFDYPCGTGPERSSCSQYRGPEAKPPADSGCSYDQKCDCYTQSSEPPAQSEPAPAPAPDQNAQPAPDQGQPPAPDQGTEPGPGQSQGEDQPF